MAPLPTNPTVAQVAQGQDQQRAAPPLGDQALPPRADFTAPTRAPHTAQALALPRVFNGPPIASAPQQTAPMGGDAPPPLSPHPTPPPASPPATPLMRDAIRVTTPAPQARPNGEVSAEPSARTGVVAGADLPDMVVQPRDADPLRPDARPGVQAAPNPAPAQAALEILSQIRQAIDQRGTAVRVTQIALNPEELGSVRLTMTGTETSGTVSILVERPETFDLVRRQIDQFQRDLRAAGWQDVQIDLARQDGGGDSRFGQSGGHGAQAALTLSNKTDAASETTQTRPEQPVAAPVRLASDGIDLRV